MKRSILGPVIRAYSRSLLGFIRFIRDHYPLPDGDGSIPPFRTSKGPRQKKP